MFLPQFSAATFVPAIFTTARLWTTEVDMSEAELESGEVKVDPTSVTERPWVWLQYHASPRHRHETTRYYPEVHHFADTGLGRLLDAEYARAIAIVGPEGIDAFLGSSIWR